MTALTSLAPAPSSVGVLPSAARTAALTSNDLNLPVGGRGLIIDIDATAKTSTPGVTVTVQGKDPLTGTYYTLLTAAAITDVGHTVLYVGPDITAVSNVAANVYVPEVVRLSIAVADTDSLTYSVAITVTP